MGNYSAYCNLATLKRRLGIATTDTGDDADLLDCLEAASRWIDDKCGRFFSVRSETRYYTALHSDRLLVDDLLSISTLKTLSANSGGTRTYGYTWASTDYDLEPYNSWPKTVVARNPGGAYTFPLYTSGAEILGRLRYETGWSSQRGVEIAGLWGYGDGESATPYEDSGTDTAEELDASETAVDVASGTAVAVGQTILVESEQMYITAIATNTLTVRRGVNGTTAATHATGKDVNVYRYPDPIVDATLLRAAQDWKATEAVFGRAGSSEFGVAETGQVDDIRILRKINPYRRVSVV